jgi:peptide/nickel transport system ATP-binding protein/oligopeptide transport system ATP-binding protein
MDRALLEVKNLRTYFLTERGVARAVDDVSFTLPDGRILGIVGESGCGKSVTALSIMRLVPQPPGRIESGEILFRGKDLLSLSEEEMREIRGNRMSMIFQEPMTSLNPVFRVGDQIAEAIEAHERIGRRESSSRAVELLARVGIPAPARSARSYPHQMSGGMRQRVMIAMAIACRPALVIADEPTTALDVTIQAQILELLNELKESIGTSIMLITHDLGVIAENAHRVVVMYAGRVVEEASVGALFADPLHPYTQGLMRSIPRRAGDGNGRRLTVIKGVVPSLMDLPPGCKFNDRCPHAFERCFAGEPGLLLPGEDHTVRCWLYDKEGK